MQTTELSLRFIYHVPEPEDIPIYGKIRTDAMIFADYLNRVCPDSRELSLAITALEQAVMWANASIARRKRG